jgi:hypothetical protein
VAVAVQLKVNLLEQVVQVVAAQRTIMRLEHELLHQYKVLQEELLPLMMQEKAAVAVELAQLELTAMVDLELAEQV